MKRNSAAINDDVANAEPPEKTVKKEEVEDPSFEILELRQKVVKLEKDYEGACRIANEYESQLQESRRRVESLENLLDAKPVTTNSEEVNERLKQLCITRASLEDSEQANRELRVQVNALMRKNEDLHKVNHSIYAKTDESTRKLVEYEKLLSGDDCDMATELSIAKLKLHEASLKNEKLQLKVEVNKKEVYELKMELCTTRNELEASKLTSQKLQLKINALTEDVVNEVTNELKEKLGMTKFQLEEECRKNEALQNKNNVLTRKNEELRRPTEDREDANKKLKLANNQLMRRLAEYEKSQKVGTKKVSYGVALSNIFLLFPWKAPETILFGHAVRMLQSAFILNDLGWMERYRKAVKDNTLTCRLCDGPTSFFKGTDILAHFFSLNHTNNMRDSAVSLTAFEYWMDKLNEIPKPKGMKAIVMMLDKDVPD